MRSTLSALLPALVLAAVLAPAPARAEEKKDPASDDKAQEREVKRQHDEAVKKAIDDFKKGWKEAKTAADRVSAVRQLGDIERDPKILTFLVGLLPEADPVRGEVMTALGKYHKYDLAAQALVRALAMHAKAPALLQRNVAALGEVAHESALPALVKLLRDKDVMVATTAVKSVAEIGTGPAVEALIAVWEELERDRRKEGDAKQSAEEHIRAMLPGLRESLARLMGQRINFVNEARDGWTKNKASFKPKEDPPAVCGHFAPPAAGAKPPVVAAGEKPPDAVAPDPAAPAPGAEPAPPPPDPSKIEGVFYRAINLNGPALVVNGNEWESGADAPKFRAQGGRPAENKTGPLSSPPVDANLGRMLRSSLACSDTLTLTMTDVPSGMGLVCLYVWEGGNTSRIFEVRLQGAIMVSNFPTGTRGQWQRLGPWPAPVGGDGTIVLVCSGAGVNVCGIEVWRKN